jgi:hypothetical protein
MAEPDSARAIRRVHKGYARLFFEELQARRETRAPNPNAPGGAERSEVEAIGALADGQTPYARIPDAARSPP